MRLALVFAVLALAAIDARATDPVPEIQRPVGTPQAVGVAHTLRQIPEACARIEGQFTGVATDPYKFTIARTSPNCQPRARLVDAAKARPSAKGGWKFNDLVRVPSASCPLQMAVVRIWRKPADVAPPKLDAQGRSRIYLKESVDAAKKGDLATVPMYAASMAIEGKGCN